MTSTAELTLEAQLSQAGIPFEREVVFAPPRKYRADFQIGHILVEVEGGTWIDGRHVQGKGFAEGCEKQALAVIAGYRYLRATTAQVEEGDCLEWIRQALGMAA